jgi:hypothetical protein
MLYASAWRVGPRFVDMKTSISPVFFVVSLHQPLGAAVLAAGRELLLTRSFGILFNTAHVAFR